jgi:hypothetical protein
VSGGLHLLKHDALGHAGSSEGIGLHGSDGVRLVVLLGRPSLLTSVVAELATATDSTWLTVTE